MTLHVCARPQEAHIEPQNEQRETAAATEGGPLRVFYDGDCPMCRREIAFLSARALPGSLDLVDISQTGHSTAGDEVAPGLSRHDALARMHVQRADGTIVSGAGAFAAMWANVPRVRFLARAAGAWPLRPLLEGCYRVFLLVRPSLQRAFRRWEVRRGDGRGLRPPSGR